MPLLTNTRLLAGLLLLTLFTFSACQDDDTMERSDTLENEAPEDIILTENEKALINDCQVMLIDDQEEMAEHIIGSWVLVAYGCSGCSPHVDPTMEVTFNTDGTGIFNKSKDGITLAPIAFTWQTLVSSFITEPEPLARISTEPDIWEINVLTACQDFLVFQPTAIADTQKFIFDRKSN